jgi:uncharacterized protein (DUF305 family)
MAATTDEVRSDDAPDDSEPDEEAHDDRDGYLMFSLPQLVALVVLAVVVSVGLTLFFTADDDQAFNDADIGFLSDMTTHHQGAITLAFDYLPNQDDQIVAHTAREIILTQSQEIATMNDLIGQAGEDAEAIEGDQLAMEWMGHPSTPGTMPGMATAEQLAQLSAATGLDADDLFTRLMINHHAAGAEMAEYEAQFGENDTVRSFAAKVAKIQRLEIDEMNARREALGLAPVDPITIDDF